jgi:thioesterase domain-containing protein
MHFPSFKEVQDIGIIYHAGNANNEAEVNKVAHFLREQGKKVWTMGYVDAKVLPHTKKFHISSEYFWKEKLNAYNLPDTAKIGNFLQHRFDLLMNLYFEEDLPLQAMSTYAISQFSMGAQLNNALTYNDSVIDTGNTKSIEHLASQMIHYLSVVNQK